MCLYNTLHAFRVRFEHFEHDEQGAFEPLSKLTLASLEDIGYIVDPGTVSTSSKFYFCIKVNPRGGWTDFGIGSPRRFRKSRWIHLACIRAECSVMYLVYSSVRVR